jgi:hypothetical protein
MKIKLVEYILIKLMDNGNVENRKELNKTIIYPYYYKMLFPIHI